MSAMCGNYGLIHSTHFYIFFVRKVKIDWFFNNPYRNNMDAETPDRLSTKTLSKLTLGSISQATTTRSK